MAYYAKARMEYMVAKTAEDWQWDPHENPWELMTGRLAWELMTGKLQLGDDTFEQHAPAEIPVAGDPTEHNMAPTYGAMGSVMLAPPMPRG